MSVKARACAEAGCGYERQGFTPCAGGCVEAGRGEDPYVTMYPPGMAGAMAAMCGLPLAARLVSSTDSVTGTEHGRMLP